MEPPAASNRAVSAAGWVVLGLIVAYGVYVAIGSLSWRMQLDTPLLHYMAFMVDEQGAAPYRDIFVTSFPGAILLHLLILKTAGHGDAAFMGFNLLWLAGLCAVTFGFMRSFGKRAAIGGGFLFALAYFHQGPNMMMQRDFALILPIAGAVWVHAGTRGGRGARAFWIGLLFSLAASVKPHAGIGLPAVLLCEWLRDRERASVRPWRTLGFAALGFAIPLGLVFLWVTSTGGLPAFVEMMREYLPLHVRLSRTHEYLEGRQRLYDFINNAAMFGRPTGPVAGVGQPGWIVGAAVGSLAVLTKGGLDTRKRRLVLLLAGLGALHWVYVMVSGQFWAYHWMPFRWVMTLLCALCLADLPELRDRVTAWHPLGSLVLTLVMVVPMSVETLTRLEGGELRPPDEGRVDEIAAFLEERLEPGDTVQPLDWARGGVHAALEAKAHIATPFVSDYHFYHHVHKPFVAELRARFMRDMHADPPRFVLEMRDRPRPSGPHTTREFPELRAMLESEYAPALEGRIVLALEGPAWIVWERKAQ